MDYKNLEGGSWVRQDQDLVWVTDQNKSPQKIRRIDGRGASHLPRSRAGTSIYNNGGDLAGGKRRKKRKSQSRSRSQSRGSKNPWIQFYKKNKRPGVSMKALAKKYRAMKQ